MQLQKPKVMNTDITNRINTVLALAAGTVNSNTDGEIIDTSKADGAGIVFAIGDGNMGDTGIAVTLNESENADMSDATEIDDDRITAGANEDGDIVMDTAETTHKVGFSRTKRYVRPSLVVSANANVPIGAVAMLLQTESPDESEV